MKENRPKYDLNGEQDDKTIKINNKDNFGDIKRPDEKDKRVHYALLKVLGIVGLGVVTAAAVGAGVGLALGGFGISMGIPLVGSALVTAGGWLATAIPGLGAAGVAVPVVLGAIAGFVIAFFAISGIRKLIKSFGNEQSRNESPGGSGAGRDEFDKLNQFMKSNMEPNKVKKPESENNKKSEEESKEKEKPEIKNKEENNAKEKDTSIPINLNQFENKPFSNNTNNTKVIIEKEEEKPKEEKEKEEKKEGEEKKE